MSESEMLKELLSFFYGEDLRWSFIEDVGIKDIDTALYKACKQYIEEQGVQKQ